MPESLLLLYVINALAWLLCSLNAHSALDFDLVKVSASGRAIESSMYPNYIHPGQMSIDDSPVPPAQSAEDSRPIDEEQKFIRDHAAEIAACIERIGQCTFALATSGPQQAGNLTITSRLLVFRDPISGTHDVIFSIIGINADDSPAFRFIGGLADLAAAFGPSHEALISTDGDYFRQLMDTVSVCPLVRAGELIIGYQIPEEMAGGGMIMVPIPSASVSANLQARLAQSRMA